MIGGALEGASTTSRELATFNPRWGSPDDIVNSAKPLIDARSSDMAQDDALSQAAINTHRDSIVGAKYTLTCKPDLRTLGVDKEAGWVEDFQGTVEARWNAVAESDACWLDASRRRTFTELCRQAVSSFTLSGEILAPVEWIRDVERPCRTAVHLISPARLSNPRGVMDQPYSSERGYSISAGVKKDFYGKHLSYFIQRAVPGDRVSRVVGQWDEVPAMLPWGRRQMIYICEPLLVEQTRGLGDMSAAVPHMRMAKKHSAVTLQNAIVNATYAAAVESDLPPAEIAVALGTLNAAAVDPANAGTVVVDGWAQTIGAYLNIISSYLGAAQNINIDGAKMPVLPPGTKFKLLNAGNGGNNYDKFQQTIDRKTAAALNMSYEEYTRDYSQLSYSGGKMSSGKTERFMSARKAVTVDRFASSAFALWLEEDIKSGAIPLPPTWASVDDYYLPLNKEAISRCSWIGTGKGQIDELKETQAAIARINAGLSTWDAEGARLGIDWREMAEQQTRERKLFTSLGLDFTLSATKPSTPVTGQQTLAGGNTEDDNAAD